MLFNEKIEAKRAISSTKLQYEEQIMRQVEIIEEKTKEISRIKANEPAVMGRN